MATDSKADPAQKSGLEDALKALGDGLASIKGVGEQFAACVAKMDAYSADMKNMLAKINPPKPAKKGEPGGEKDGDSTTDDSTDNDADAGPDEMSAIRAELKAAKEERLKLRKEMSALGLRTTEAKDGQDDKTKAEMSDAEKGKKDEDTKGKSARERLSSLVTKTAQEMKISRGEATQLCVRQDRELYAETLRERGIYDPSNDAKRGYLAAK